MTPTADRGDLVEKAAAMVQRGELGAALPEYERLFHRNPDDWNIANTLGDLYVRVGKTDDAVAHFTALAERLAEDGFTSKARALFRKILRVRPNHDVARRRVVELDGSSAGVSPFLQRVLQTAREAREAHNQERVPEPVIVSPPALVVEAPPPPAPVVAAFPPAPAVAAAPPPPLESPIETEIEITFEPDVELPPSTPREESQPVTLAAAAAEERDEASCLTRAMAAADAALAQCDYTAAMTALELFLEGSPYHIGALEKLVDVGVEAGLDGQLRSVQLRLMEACRSAGFEDRARYIADDLRERYEQTPVPEVESFEPVPGVEPEPVVEPDSVVEPEPVVGAEPVVESPAQSELVVKTEPVVEAIDDPTETFDELRAHVLEEAAVRAEERFAAADGLIAARQSDEAVAALEEAMCLPHLRVAAGAHLARFYRDTAAPLDALACLEWVAEMPPANEEEGHELAYELALTLEALDQHAQALGVYRELLTEVGPAFRDIAERADRLAGC